MSKYVERYKVIEIIEGMQRNLCKHGECRQTLVCEEYRKEFDDLQYIIDTISEFFTIEPDKNIICDIEHKIVGSEDKVDESIKNNEHNDTIYWKGYRDGIKAVLRDLEK